MQGLDRILGSSGVDIDSLAVRFGISPEQARAALGSLMPAVAGGIERQADKGGLSGVAVAGSNVGEPETGVGNDVLAQIFGTKDTSRQVADDAARQSGVSSAILRAMLPVVAAMVAKHLAQDGHVGGGALGGILGSILGQGGGQAGGQGGLMGGGNPLDAILGGRR